MRKFTFYILCILLITILATILFKSNLLGLITPKNINTNNVSNSNNIESQDVLKSGSGVYDDNNMTPDKNYVSTNSSITSKQTLTENYKSIIDLSTIEYRYNDMIKDIDKLISMFPDKVKKVIIGKSVLGRDIPAVIIGNVNGLENLSKLEKNIPHRFFIMGNSHARETHSTPIIMKQIEFYLYNWNNYYNGQKLKDIFSKSAIFYVPMQNPDGTELVFSGLNSVNDSIRYENLLAMLKNKIDNHLINPGDVDSNWQYNDKDFRVWKSNINGVDLHYNFWEDGVNDEDVKSYTATDPKWWAKSEPASEYYIGSSGLSEPETKAVVNFIDKYKLFNYAITYHGRGPTIFWNYKLSGEVYEKNKNIVIDIAILTQSPFSLSDSLPIGFVGWYTKKYGGFAANLEIGWNEYPFDFDTMQNNTNSSVDACPLMAKQLHYIWKVQKYTPLYILQKYVNKSDNTTVSSLSKLP